MTQRLREKAVLGAVCEQANKAVMGFTIDAMHLPLEALDYEIVGELSAFGIFDKAKIKEREDMLIEAATLGGRLAQSLIERRPA